MKGMWREPFGLKGFAFGDMAISLSINWQSGVPSGFGITGKMDIGNTKMMFALAVDATSGFLISGSISRLTLADIVLLAVCLLSPPTFSRGFFADTHFFFSLAQKKAGASISTSAVRQIPRIELHDFRR